MLGGADFDYAGYPQFNTPWEVGTAAIDAGFDIFTCATNHSMDVGFKGIEQECKFLTSIRKLFMLAQMIRKKIITLLFTILKMI